jgi:UDPglucose 6-dehydrogenase
MEDTLRPDRIVIGVDDAPAVDILRELYAPILATGVQLIVTDPRTAELSKLASNAFLATKISFANALAQMSELVGADVTGVTEIMGADSRIGGAFLGAGLGYGGYCLPKDIATLESAAARLGLDFGLLREVQRLNVDALTAVQRKIEEAIWNIEGKSVALLGLAFKAGTDDVRSAPALALASWLLGEGAHVIGHDPMASEHATEVETRLMIASSPYEAASGAHCLVVCTEWPEYKDLDLVRLREAMAIPAVVDARNLLDPDAVADAGFLYLPVGRPARGHEPVHR